jgi:protein ImuB
MSARVSRSGHAGLPQPMRPDAPLLPAPAAAALHPVAAAAAACPAPQLWAAVHLPGCAAQQELSPLAARAQRFSPRVSLAPPDGLLLEVRGSLQLFKGVAGLRAALAAEYSALGARIAFAPTPLAALIGARAGRAFEIVEFSQLTGQIAPLPLTLLRWPEETLARLKRLGVRTVGAALRLPRAGFARRFGAAQLAVLDQLTVRAPDLREPFHPRARFRRRRELDCELSDHRLLRAALEPLFADLGAFLVGRQYGVMELECSFVHRHAPPTRCLLRLAAPCADIERLDSLLATHLEALQLPEAARSCELRAQALLPHQPGSECLWQPGEQGGSVLRESFGLIERLRARLGPEAVHGLRLLEGHRPEHAWSMSPPPPARSPGAGHDDSRDAHAGRRPLWLLTRPLPLAAPHGLPHRGGPLRLVSEPERIESGWWDGNDIARDYYTAVDPHGVRLWVFRERSAPHRWFLHGVFG